MYQLHLSCWKFFDHSSIFQRNDAPNLSQTNKHVSTSFQSSEFGTHSEQLRHLAQELRRRRPLTPAVHATSAAHSSVCEPWSLPPLVHRRWNLFEAWTIVSVAAPLKPTPSISSTVTP